MDNLRISAKLYFPDTSNKREKIPVQAVSLKPGSLICDLAQMCCEFQLQDVGSGVHVEYKEVGNGGKQR